MKIKYRLIRINQFNLKKKPLLSLEHHHILNTFFTPRGSIVGFKHHFFVGIKLWSSFLESFHTVASMPDKHILIV